MYKKYVVINQECITHCDFETYRIGSYACTNRCDFFIETIEISKTDYMINCKKYNKFREEKLKRILEI
jgi:hypothetical protein